MTLADTIDRLDLALAHWDRIKASASRRNLSKLDIIIEDNRTQIQIFSALLAAGFNTWADFYAFYLLTETDHEYLDGWAMARHIRTAKVVDRVDNYFDWPQPDPRTVS